MRLALVPPSKLNSEQLPFYEDMKAASLPSMAPSRPCVTTERFWVLGTRGYTIPERNRVLLWCTFLSFPLPHIAILTGWFTADVGRQPWTVYGVLRTADALTPFLTTRAATISLVVFSAVYVFIFAFGILYIYRLLRAGPTGNLVLPPAAAIPNRPMSVVDHSTLPDARRFAPGG